MELSYLNFFRFRRMEEWKPLLGAESSLNPLVFDAPPMAAPPSYSEIQQEIAGMGVPDPTSDIIMCEVCNYPINRSGAERKKVIMCPRCQEATVSMHITSCYIIVRIIAIIIIIYMDFVCKQKLVQRLIVIFMCRSI